MTRPIIGSPPTFGRSGDPSLGQKRSPVSYSLPHCGQILAMATASSAAGVGCCASKPEPSALGTRCGSVTSAAEPALGSPDALASERDGLSGSRSSWLNMIERSLRQQYSRRACIATVWTVPVVPILPGSGCYEVTPDYK